MATSTTASAALAGLADGQRQLETLEQLSGRFGDSLSSALAAGAKGGRDLDDVLASVGQRLATSLGSSAVSSLGASLGGALQGAAQSLTAGLSLSSFGGALPFAQGGIVSAGAVTPFADGGIVAAPTYFPLGRGLGLMGESGTEAVMPLARGSDGRLGVATSGGGATQVTVNVQATDLDSFKRSEAQVSAALARAVARGRRAL